MNIVDSSAWLEYFAGTAQANHFAAVIENTPELLVPAVTMYEVFKKILKNKGETEAVEAIEQMQKGKIIEIDDWTSILAAKVGLGENLGMADAMIYAVTLLHDATLWTQDSDFKGLPNVKFFAKV